MRRCSRGDLLVYAWVALRIIAVVVIIARGSSCASAGRKERTLDHHAETLVAVGPVKDRL